jgi:drug/metabolite transporter (DMT)-like permease
LRPLLAHKGAICAFGLVEFAVPFAAISLAERWISSSIAGILIATVPLIIALISRFFGVYERFGPWRVLGLLVGLSGVIALLGLGSVSGPLGWAGVGCIALATIGYAIGPLIVQRHLKLIDPFGPIAASLLIAALMLLPAALCSFPAQMPSALALVSIAVLGVVCTALAMLLLFYLIGHAGAARASVITYINPAVASLLGVAILHEHLGVGGPTGLALILAGSWLATRGALAVPGASSETPAVGN